jgi:uncharacterized membrane protein
MSGFFPRWRASFLTGFAIVLPAVLSLAVVNWLFGTIANITDFLLIFLPARWTHHNEGLGPMKWYWSVCALVLAMILVALIGQFARYYIGKRAIRSLDHLMLQVPLLNKVYSTIKQVNEAFSANNKSSFKQVVLVDFPHPGQKAVGFITNDQLQEVAPTGGEPLVSVFVPTTPNPTGGFLLLMPQSQLVKLDMTVAEGIKFIISLGAIPPDFVAGKIAAAPGLPAIEASTSGKTAT